MRDVNGADLVDVVDQMGLQWSDWCLALGIRVAAYHLRSTMDCSAITSHQGEVASDKALRGSSLGREQ